MYVLWRYRLAAPLLAVLLLIVCEAQIDNEAQISKLYPRGNHWAVGHLMGKKSIDELVESNDRDSVGDEGYLTAEEQREALTQTPGLLRALVIALAGLEREKERGSSAQHQRAPEPRRLREEQEERDIELKQAAKILLLTLNMRDSSGS